MKIKQELPQFKNKFAYILVSGKEHAIIYLANDGLIKKIDEIKIKKDKYSDREGHFKRSGGNKVISSGAVYEDVDKEKRLKEFTEEISNKFKRFKKIDYIYCYYPAYMKNRLKKILNDYNVKQFFFLGNYTDFHPFKLLEKIKKN